MISPNSRLIKKVAESMGGSVEELLPERNFFILHFGEKEIPVARNFVIPRPHLCVREATVRKDLTQALLERKSLPVPRTVVFRNNTRDDAAFQLLSDLKLPLVIKPAAGTKSIGVVPFVQSVDRAKETVADMLKTDPCVLVQEMIRGHEYRVLVLENEILGVLEMIPPFVTGDGQSSVETLIKQHAVASKLLTDDALLTQTLASQNISLTNIPSAETRVFLKLHSSLANGGITSDMTAKIHPSIADICICAAKAASHYLVGIDLICDDIEKPAMVQKNLAILELNGKPDLYIHHRPNVGTPQNVIQKILTFLIERL